MRTKHHAKAVIPTMEVEARDAGIQEHPRLHSKFGTGLLAWAKGLIWKQKRKGEKRGRQASCNGTCHQACHPSFFCENNMVEGKNTTLTGHVQHTYYNTHDFLKERKIAA